MSGSMGYSMREDNVLPLSCERIVVVKGDRLRADAIVRAAREACPGSEITVCHSASEATAVLRSRPARLGLIGLTLPDRDGLDLLADAGRERWFDQILVVSDRRDERTRYCLKAAKLNGFFDCAGDDPAALAPAIRKVVSGFTYFSPEVLDVRIGFTGKRTKLTQVLTATELQVFGVVGDGCDDNQGAERLGMHETTVHTHRQRIMRKLAVRIRTDLMREALRRGVVRFTAAGRALAPGQEHLLAEHALRRRKRSGARVVFSALK